MARRLYKVVDLGDGKSIRIYGSNRNIKTYTIQSDNHEEIRFKYEGRTYKLSDFISIHNKVYNPNPPVWMTEFDGYLSDSYFSGIIIKLGENAESVKVFTYLS